MTYTAMPIGEQYTLQELRNVVNYVKSLSHKVLVYDFLYNDMMKEFEALYRYDKAIFPLQQVEQIVPTAQTIGATHIIGPTLTAAEKTSLERLGVEQFIVLEEQQTPAQYKRLKEVATSGKLTYVTATAQQAAYNMLHGLLYGYDLSANQEPILLGGNGIIDTRNLLYGPIVSEEQIVNELLPIGVKQVVYIHAHATTSQQQLDQLQQLMARYDLELDVHELEADYYKTVIANINLETGANYVMVDESILPLVVDLLEKY